MRVTDAAIGDPRTAPVVRDALAQRLGAAAPFLMEQSPADPDPAYLLDALVDAVRRGPSAQRVWLLFVAVTGRFPTSDDAAEAIRRVELESTTDITLWLLDVALESRHNVVIPVHPMRVVTDTVLADIDHTARYELHTGIQQVVRRTVPIWVRDHDVVPVAWSQGYQALRALTPAEWRRVENFTDTLGSAADPDRADDPIELIVPWNCTIALFEVSPPGTPDRLAALAQYSGSELVVVGHDCIPVVSGDLVPLSDHFPHFLSAVKYARRIAGVSVSATAEFRGFADTLATQGLPAPQVNECQLATEPLPADRSAGASGPRALPLVLSVGSFEPRKNGLAVLHCAERLWRDGLRFELRFIGGSGWGTRFPAELAALQAKGRAVSAQQGVDEATLAQAYRTARFTVFASLHEGYGLPAAESLAAGTPVLTSNFGSTLETAQPGGAVTVDPRDDDAITEAMRRLLTDDALIGRLRAEIARRPVRTWADYARELWATLIVPDGR